VRAPVDEASVLRALTNLVDNAVRHSPSSSTVEVTVSLNSEDRGHTAAVISVTDHGQGIPCDAQSDVFERYWRGAEGRTGLGLPIARQVVAAHGGTLTLTSPGPAGDGCRFELTLPAVHNTS
jgi:two-component system OmpR family sensor kinase